MNTVGFVAFSTRLPVNNHLTVTNALPDVPIKNYPIFHCRYRSGFSFLKPDYFLLIWHCWYIRHIWHNYSSLLLYLIDTLIHQIAEKNYSFCYSIVSHPFSCYACNVNLSHLISLKQALKRYCISMLLLTNNYFRKWCFILEERDEFPL